MITDESVSGLAPCPFCGAVPDVRKDRASVTCRNAACTVNPAVSAFTLDKAIEYWNRRSHQEGWRDDIAAIPKDDGALIEVRLRYVTETWNAARFLRLHGDEFGIYEWRPLAAAPSPKEGK